MADTRKDKRAPISLKVRFKSATLDEFIEQYSVDISRGGIFIKSKTPMSVGTLLKFEFRLKDESRLIHGVGRVVWKREEEGDSSKPPGMGIKFIKMDPESRGLVEQMVAKRGDAPGRFEEGQEGDSPASSGGFFPSTTPESELPPPEDRTQVRHASEFLASALAEGGSESASKEAEKKAEEARKRTEEIEQKRAEQAKRKSPRLKKTLVGVGIPDEVSEDEPTKAPAIAAGDPEKTSDGAADETSDGAAEASADAEDTRADAADTVADASADETEASADDTSADETEASADEASASEASADASEPEDDAADGRTVSESAETLALPRGELARAAEEKAAESEDDDDAAAAKPAVDEAPPKPVEKPRPAVRAPEPVTEEPRSRAGMILFGAVAAAALGLVVWYQMKPTGEETPPAETQIGTQPTDPVVDEPVEPPAEDLLEEPAPPATTAVQIVTTPAGATVLVDGEDRGVTPTEVQLPIGVSATVETRLDGYGSTTRDVTAAEGQAPIELELEQLTYVIHVESTPPGARVRSSVGAVVAPGDLTLRQPPTGPVALTATLRGHQNGAAEVTPAQFTESEGRMLATVTVTLEERVRARPEPPQPRPQPREQPAEEEPDEEPAPEPAAESPSEEPAQAEEAPEPAAPEPAEPAEEPADQAPPDNPFG